MKKAQKMHNNMQNTIIGLFSGIKEFQCNAQKKKNNWLRPLWRSTCPLYVQLIVTAVC